MEEVIGTVAVGFVLLVMVGLIIRKIVLDKKKGKPIQCGGDCSNCGGHCH